MRTLYGMGISPYVRKARICLVAKGLDFAHDPVNPRKAGEAFKHLSPLGQVPAFVDEDGTVVADSSVICAYLEKRYPKPALLPEEPKAYARALWFEEFSDSGLGAQFAKLFVQEFMNRRIYKQPEDEGVIAEAEAAIQPLFAYLEREVTEDWMVPGHFTLADVALGAMLANYGVTLKRGFAGFPRLEAYAGRLFAHGPVARVLQDELDDIARKKSQAQP